MPVTRAGTLKTEVWKLGWPNHSSSGFVDDNQFKRDQMKYRFLTYERVHVSTVVLPPPLPRKLP
jgi:hypothetical protein